MPYVVAIAFVLFGLTIIREVFILAGAYGLNSITLEWIVMLMFGLSLTYLGWFIFRETLTRTYTIRKR